MKKILEIQKKLAQEAMSPSIVGSIIFATVTSVSPIKISVESMQEDVTEEFIIVGAMCRRYVLPIPHKHIGCYHPTTGFETEEIEVWRGLQVGDKVICTRLNNGQIYYIIQRVEMEGFR